MSSQDRHRPGSRRAWWAGAFGLSSVAGFGTAVKAVAVVTAVAVTASVVTGSAPRPDLQDWLGGAALPEVQQEPSVPGGPVPVAHALGVDHTAERAMTEPARPNWPAAGSAVLDLPGRAAEKARADGLPVRVGQGKGAVGPERVRVEVLDREHARGLGVDGVVFTVADTDRGRGGEVEVELDYGDFARAYGGGWASRLVLVELPACALTTPERPECRTATPLPGRNAPARGLLSGTVVLTASGQPSTGQPSTGQPSTESPSPAPPSPAPSSTVPSSPVPQVPEPSAPGTTSPAPTGESPPTTAQVAGFARTASLRQAAEDSPTVLAAVAGAKGSEGDFTASDLSPTGSWSAGGPSGDFTYSYPMPVPPVPGGLVPDLALAYNSGSVDGRTSATNAQASWVGDGWEFTPGGFVERRYKGCAEDDGGNQGALESADLCWAGESAVISVGGVTGELIKDATTGRWVARTDSGAKIELRTGATNGDNDGEHWVVTTTDGTRYFLGLNRLPDAPAGTPDTGSTFTVPVFGNHANEQCNAATFAASWCHQAWRWNLDLVIDAHGNAMVFRYAQEKNRYTRGGIDGAATEYVRGGHLTAIDYGLREDALFASPPAKAEFEVAERCLPAGAVTCAPEQRTEANASHWPDVPVDLICRDGSDCKAVFVNHEWDPGVHTPAFFTTKRLTKVTAKVNVGDWQPVDSWALTHLFPATTDGTDPALWLRTVQRTGHVGGTATTPTTTFAGSPLDNRVDARTEIRPLSRYRLTGIDNGHGGNTGVRYHDRDCVAGQPMPAPESNTRRCFPMWWKPYSGYDNPILDWFHKYAVAEVVEQDLTGGSPAVRTNYDYTGGAAWSWDDNEMVPATERSWSRWRGFGAVRTTLGDPGSGQVVTESQYLRGMDGDRLPGGAKRSVSVPGTDDAATDHEALTGFLREERTLLDGALVGLVINDPWVSGPTATMGDKRAYKVNVKSIRKRDRLADGTWWRTKQVVEFDSGGFPIREEDFGVVSAWDETTASGDEKCTRTTYVSNADKHLLGLRATTTTHVGTCATEAAPGTVLSAGQFAYDGQEVGAAPLRGDVTTALALDSWTEAVGRDWSRTQATYDGYGRTSTSVDVLGATSTTEYAPATGLATSVRATNALGHSTLTQLDPRRGRPVATTDAAGVITQGEFDPLGRTARVWAAGVADKTKAPAAVFEYATRADGPSVIATKSLQDSGAYKTSFTLLDGLLRNRQSQTPATTAGRIITDTIYDTRGLVVKTNNGYYNEEEPSTTLYGAADNYVPNQTVTEYDTLGRATASIYRKKAVEQWRTTTVHHGADKVSTVPPEGGTGTALIVDAFGRHVEKRDYKVRTEAGNDEATAFQATRYTYHRGGGLATVTDPAGAKWTFEYDLAGNKVRTTDPDAGVSTTAYDKAGRPVSATDGRGFTVATAYDVLGRKTATHEGSPSGLKLTEFTYDALGNGRPVSATRYSDGHAYRTETTGFDSAGRTTGTKITIPAVEGVLQGEYLYEQTYTATGKLATESMPAAGGLAREVVHHTYDGAGLPETSFAFNPVSGSTATYVSDSTYSVYGEMLQVVRGAATSPRNVVTTNFYDEGTRRLIQSVVNRETTSQSNVVDRRYGYDQAGNITRISDVPAGGPHDTQCFGHDWLGRLASAWTPASGDCSAAPTTAALGGAAPYWLEWEFDAAGNRLTEKSHATAGTTVRTYGHPTADAAGLGQPHTTRSVTETAPDGAQRTSSFGYDAAGNTLTRQVDGVTQELHWNSEGRVASVTEGTKVVSSYLYDATGVRLIARDADGTTLYLPGQEVRLPKGSTATSCVRYYRHGDAVAMQRSTAGGLAYLIGDHQGTGVMSLRTSDLTVTRRYQLPHGGARGAQPAWLNDKGFVGGDRDPTGLTHVGAREYDPALGRFVSVDPVVDFHDPRQMHGYAYAHHSPVTLSDPSGEFVDLLIQAIQMIATALANAIAAASKGKSGTANTRTGPKVTHVDTVNAIPPGKGWGPYNRQLVLNRETGKWDAYDVYQDTYSVEGECGGAAPGFVGPIQDCTGTLVMQRTVLHQTGLDCGAHGTPQCPRIENARATPGSAPLPTVGDVVDFFVGDIIDCGKNPGLTMSCGMAVIGFIPLGKGAKLAANAVEAGVDAAQAAAKAGRAGVIPSSGRTFVATPQGTVYDVPKNWVGAPAANGKGIIYQRPGATANADMIRIMDPTPMYPNGYVRVHNKHGQPVDVNGKPGSKADTHIPAEYQGYWPSWPQ
ncbi:RHS repeat domain-containing protein [Saccharothrix texasensis]|uniref:RHS repeat-associated protein n=1 Tax=Saccharothrix texasensis TaxID=103734 RepID=A0A3N1H3S8_9PSEU|nr:RHS repeat-associated core domain-containing protein [Saccharothrix texasensis]ROP37183.1 RHS repeat-associated protein [Saccharothrix texasensis]